MLSMEDSCLECSGIRIAFMYSPPIWAETSQNCPSTIVTTVNSNRPENSLFRHKLPPLAWRFSTKTRPMYRCRRWANCWYSIQPPCSKPGRLISTAVFLTWRTRMEPLSRIRVPVQWLSEMECCLSLWMRWWVNIGYLQKSDLIQTWLLLTLKQISLRRSLRKKVAASLSHPVLLTARRFSWTSKGIFTLPAWEDSDINQ